MEAVEKVEESVYFKPAQQRQLSHYAGVIAEYAEVEGLDMDDVVSFIEKILYDADEFKYSDHNI